MFAADKDTIFIKSPGADLQVLDTGKGGLSLYVTNTTDEKWRLYRSGIQMSVDDARRLGNALVEMCDEIERGGGA